MRAVFFESQKGVSDLKHVGVPRIATINGHFSIQNHRFSGAILHSFCIFNRKLRKKLAIYIASTQQINPQNRPKLQKTKTNFRSVSGLSIVPALVGDAPAGATTGATTAKIMRRAMSPPLPLLR